MNDINSDVFSYSISPRFFWISRSVFLPSCVTFVLKTERGNWAADDVGWSTERRARAAIQRRRPEMENDGDVIGDGERCLSERLGRCIVSFVTTFRLVTVLLLLLP